MTNIIKNNPATIAFYALLLSLGGVLYYYLYLRYIGFSLREVGDSTTYMQVAWSVLNSTNFTMSINESFISYFPNNFLGDQLILILAFLSPLLMLSTSGELFLVVQVAIIISAGALLYHYSNQNLHDQKMAFLIALTYLVNVGTLATFMDFGFRAETFFIPLIFGVFLSLHNHKKVLAGFLLILVLITKHNSIPILFLLGCYFLFFKRENWKIGFFCIFSSVLYYFVGVKGLMGSLQENPIAHYKHFSQFGATPAEAVWKMISEPSLVLEMISENELRFFMTTLAPLGFLCLISPLFYIAAPQLLMTVVLKDYHSVFCGWHMALIIPWVFLGTVWTVEKILKTKSASVIRYTLYFLLIFQTMFHVKIGYDKFFPIIANQNTQEISEKFQRISSVMAEIPDNKSLMVSAQLLWHAYDRERVYMSRTRFHEEVDYIALHLPVNGDRHYANQDRNILREMRLAMSDKPSKFDNFFIKYQTSEIVLLQNKKL